MFKVSQSRNNISEYDKRYEVKQTPMLEVLYTIEKARQRKKKQESERSRRRDRKNTFT